MDSAVSLSLDAYRESLGAPRFQRRYCLRFRVFRSILRLRAERANGLQNTNDRFDPDRLLTPLSI